MSDVVRRPAFPVPEIDYETRLPAWERDVIGSGDHRDFDYWVTYDPSPGIERLAAEGRLRADGATQAEVTGVERRLGKPLPPSYREFLAASNGLFKAHPNFSLLPADEVCLLADDFPDWAHAGEIGTEASDDVYFAYGEDQDPIWMRWRYMENAVRVSDVVEGDVALLIPDVRFGDEWEVWMLGLKLLGAYRYRSFAEFFEREVLARSYH